MANLHNLPPMGAEGVPEPKRLKLDSTTSETSEVLAKILEFDDLPDELMLSSNFLTAELPLPEPNAQPQSQQQNQSVPAAVNSTGPSGHNAQVSGNPGGSSNPSSNATPNSNSSHMQGPSAATSSVNMYSNSPGFSNLTSVGGSTLNAASPKPNASISTSGDPTPTLPSVSSTPAHPTSSMSEAASHSFPMSLPSSGSSFTSSSSLPGSISAGMAPGYAQGPGLAASYSQAQGYGASVNYSQAQRSGVSYSQSPMMHQIPSGMHHPHPHQPGGMPMQSRMAHHQVMSARPGMHPGMGVHAGMSHQQPMVPGAMRMNPHMGQPGYGSPPMHRTMVSSGMMVRPSGMTNQHMAPSMAHTMAPHPQGHPPMHGMQPQMAPGMRPNPAAMGPTLHNPGPGHNPNPASATSYQDGLLSSLEPTLRTSTDFSLGPSSGLSPQQPMPQRQSPGQPASIQTVPNLPPSQQSPAAAGQMQAMPQQTPPQQKTAGEVGTFGAQPPSSSSASPTLNSLSVDASKQPSLQSGQSPSQQPTAASALGGVNGTPPQQSSVQTQPLTPSSKPPVSSSQQTTPSQPQSGGPQQTTPPQVGVGGAQGLGQGQNPQGQVGQASDPEKRKLIQQQLVLLLHAHKCQRREREQQGNGEFRPCTLPHCRTMKNVLNHMTECQAGRSCTYHHCASSRQIIAHWKNCQRHDCPVCLPLKTASLQHKRDPLIPGGGPMGGPRPGGGMMPGGHLQGMGGQQPNMSRPMMPQGQPHQIPSGSGPPGYLGADPSVPYGGPNLNLRGPSVFDPTEMGQPPKIPYSVPIPTIQGLPTQAWHQHVNPDLRQHLVRKLVEAIYPVQDPAALQDRRVASLIQYAMKVEKAMFEAASSREEYYQLLAEKIYRIRKELEERRKMKQHNIAGPNQPPMMNGEPIAHKPNNYLYSNPGSANYPQPHQGMPGQVAARGGANSPGALPPVTSSSIQPPSFPSSPYSSSSDKAKLLMSPPNFPFSVPMPSSIPSSSPSSSTQLPLTTDSQQSSAPSSKPEVKSEGKPLDVKMEIKSEHTSPPGSIKNPPSSISRTDAEVKLEDVKSEIKSLPSIPALPTPPQALVPSVKAVPSVPPPSTPTGMDTAEAAASPQQKVVPDPTLRKVFTREELESALRPVFDVVWNQDPEAYPFRQPVDPKALGIPDYFDIIKKPMDLSYISRKLKCGDYKTPWEFCEDIWLMFDNAWLYNKKTSRVYKFCTKLSEVFDQHIDGVMQNLGYCCGRKFTFHPQVLYCFGKPLCTIPRDSPYYGYQSRTSLYVYCPKCFHEMPGDTITTGDDPVSASLIPKTQFKELKNDSVDYEPMVECIHCRRSMHKICVLHHEQIWPEGFQCDSCLRAKGTQRKCMKKFSAKRLPITKLGQFLEERVNGFLRMTDSEGGEVTIRVVSSTDKILDTRTLMRDRFAGEFPEQFPYRSKAMFVFEEIDGVDVCFFGMHVQEYGSDCQAPNTRRVYISYLDSVHFFRPRHLRTLVYHEILIGYLDFCKRNGFQMAHIWACPPSEGDDYIFHCHPVEQKIPKPKRLVEWYRKMLDRGKTDNVVYDYRDIFKYATEDGMLSVTEIPYFDGDFWPNVVEETIKELDQEAKEREASEQASVEGRGMKKAGKRNNNKKGSKKASGARSKSSKKGSVVIGGDSLSQKIYQTMEKHKDVFFVVNLHPPESPEAPPPITTDPDQLITCDLMDGRDAFLTMAREKHWEFSSLRRAKFSSMAMLYELHNQSGDRFVYTCNHCRMNVETRYHCKECNDFDLCVVCYKEQGHPHPMEKLGLGILDDEPKTEENKDPREMRRLSMERCIQYLVHASQCRDVHCRLMSCIKMKRILRHTKDCKLRLTRSCNICKQFLVLCYTHAKSCTDTKCPVPVCARLKKNIREQQAAQRRRNDRFTYKRMQNMSTLNNSSSSSNAAASSGASPIPANHTSPTESKIPSQSPSKGSPANALPPSAATGVNSPAVMVGSPINPRSVGKGGPRTPGEGHAPQVATRVAGGPQPAGTVPPYNKPDQSMPAPNVTVSHAPAALPGELSITRVPMQEQQLINALRSGNPQERQSAMMYMQSHPDVSQRVQYQMRQLQQAPTQAQGMPREMMGRAPTYHGGTSQVQSQPNAMMMRTQQPHMMGYGAGGNQPMRPTMQTHQNYPGGMMQHTYRAPAQPQPHVNYQNMAPAAPGPSPQQQHTQLQKILSARPPVQQFSSNAYQQMGPSPHAMGPPPYPSTAVRHSGPQTAGYPHVLGQHNPMGQPMAGQMPPHGGPQYAGHQTMPMDPTGMQHDPAFLYGPQYGLNSSNNNNTLSQDPIGGGLTPQDQLSRFVEKL